ncbi:hypothetical protein ScPMuIL_002245 [Solemya velum]
MLAPIVQGYMFGSRSAYRRVARVFTIKRPIRPVVPVLGGGLMTLAVSHSTFVAAYRESYLVGGTVSVTKVIARWVHLVQKRGAH